MLSLRTWLAAFFTLLALLALFLKLPGVAEFVGLTGCTSCSASSPLLPMAAAGYFALLLTAILAFSPFAPLPLARAGLFFAAGLAATLTILSPEWCGVCLFAHACHLSAWGVLVFFQEKKEREETLFGLKLALLFTAPVAMMALFSTLNFTLVIYSLSHESPLATLVKPGDTLKSFQLGTFSNETLGGFAGTLFTFVSPYCPYCKELLPRLDAMAAEFVEKGILFVSIGRALGEEMKSLGPHLTWIEDPKGDVISLFGIAGFPTTVLVDRSGKVVTTLPGAPAHFTDEFGKALSTLVP